jgi:hypothetical protein
VGKSGNTSARAIEVTANGLILPALMNSMDVGTLSNINCTRPHLANQIPARKYVMITMITTCIMCPCAAIA